jgi:hypothetical protein
LLQGRHENKVKVDDWNRGAVTLLLATAEPSPWYHPISRYWINLHYCVLSENLAFQKAVIDFIDESGRHNSCPRIRWVAFEKDPAS